MLVYGTAHFQIMAHECAQLNNGGGSFSAPLSAPLRYSVLRVSGSSRISGRVLPSTDNVLTLFTPMLTTACSLFTPWAMGRSAEAAVFKGSALVSSGISQVLHFIHPSLTATHVIHCVKMELLKVVAFLSVFLLPLGIRLQVEGAPVIPNTVGDLGTVDDAERSPVSVNNAEGSSLTEALDSASSPDTGPSVSPASCLCEDIHTRLTELEEELTRQRRPYREEEDHTPIRTRNPSIPPCL